MVPTSKAPTSNGREGKEMGEVPNDLCPRVPETLAPSLVRGRTGALEHWFAGRGAI